MYTTIKNCRICNSDKFSNVLNLDSQYIANQFHDNIDLPKDAIPLHLIKCEDCSFVQLEHSVDYNNMYEKYWYKSGVNQTMRDHLESIAKKVMEIQPLKTGDFVLDIGCNDGTLIKNYPSHVVKVGVDPSNINPEPADIFINNYFEAKNVLPYIFGNKFKIITSIAMFYDLNEPKKFVKDIETCLDNDGIWIAELSYMPEMLYKNSFDTICHEHVGYYNITTFNKTLEGTNLEIFNVDYNDINGGSFRIYVGFKGKRKPYIENELTLSFESVYNDSFPYDAFRDNVAHQCDLLKKSLEKWKLEGKKVYGYGASTKGQIILQHCNIDSSHIKAIAERNPLKYNLYTPGTNIRICSEEEMRNDKPDYLVIFPWYFKDEFIKREVDLIKSGTKFVFPLPLFSIEG